MKAHPATAETTRPMPVRELVFAPEQFQQFASVAEAFFFNAAENPQTIAYDQAQRDALDEHGRRKYVAVSRANSAARVLKLAAFWESVGVQRGDAVAVLSLDRPEWTETEMALFTVGAIVVPVYVRDTPERLSYILRDAGVTYAAVENQQQLEKLLRMIDNQSAPKIRHVLTFEETSPPTNYAAVTSLRSVEGAPNSVREPNSFASVNTQRDDLACIYYTSGSSGQPKGVPVTHGQILANLYQIAAAEMVDYRSLNQSGQQPIVTFLLPERAHAYPSRSAQLVACSPARARYPAVVDRLRSEIDETFRDSVRRDLREAGAGMIPIVPKIAIAIQQRVRQRLAAGGWRERLAAILINGFVAKSLRDMRGERRWTRDLLHALLKPLQRRVAQRVRPEIVGPDFDYFISGGAKLPPETAAFLAANGLPIYEGYGSTETNCPIASNTPREHRLGSVGKVFRDVDVKIDPRTRELLVKGANVVTGYLHGDETTANWDEDGWYHTRDVASLDDDGFLHIEERLDNVLVLLNGENVCPVSIENRCAAIAGVESVIVIGDRRPALVALVAMNEAAALQWADDHGHVLAAPWRHDPALLTWLRSEVQTHVNQNAGHPYECIRNIAIIEPPSVERQTLTATEKIRRKEIERRYAGLIDALYANPHEWIHPEPHIAIGARRVAAL